MQFVTSNSFYNAHHAALQRSWSLLATFKRGVADITPCPEYLTLQRSSFLFFFRSFLRFFYLFVLSIFFIKVHLACVFSTFSWVCCCGHIYVLSLYACFVFLSTTQCLTFVNTDGFGRLHSLRRTLLCADRGMHALAKGEKGSLRTWSPWALSGPWHTVWTAWGTWGTPACKQHAALMRGPSHQGWLCRKHTESALI